MIKKPRHLKNDAGDYWKRNAPIAYRLGTLTEATVDAFGELCRLYAVMVAIDTVNDPKGTSKYVNAHKLYSQQARYFGLCPFRAPEGKPEVERVNVNPFTED